MGNSAFQGSPLHGNTLGTFEVLKILRQKWRVGSASIRPIQNEKAEFRHENTALPSLGNLFVGRSLCLPPFAFMLPRVGKCKYGGFLNLTFGLVNTSQHQSTVVTDLQQPECLEFEFRIDEFEITCLARSG